MAGHGNGHSSELALPEDSRVLIHADAKVFSIPVFCTRTSPSHSPVKQKSNSLFAGTSPSSIGQARENSSRFGVTFPCSLRGQSAAVPA